MPCSAIQCNREGRFASAVDKSRFHCPHEITQANPPLPFSTMPPPEEAPSLAQLEPAEGPLELRRAIEEDLDSITEITRASFPDDPEWKYRFPDQHRFPEDNQIHIQQEYESYLNQLNKFIMLVVVTPVKTVKRDIIKMLVMLGIYDISFTILAIECGIGGR